MSSNSWTKDDVASNYVSGSSSELDSLKGWQAKSLRSVSASRFNVFLLPRRRLRYNKAFLDGSVDKHMQTDTNKHTITGKDDKMFTVIMCALPLDHLKWEQDELFPIVTDLKIHPAHPRRGLTVSWASVMRIRDGTRPHLPRLNTGITVVLIHSSQLTKQTAGVWRGFEAWKTSGQAQGEPSVEERKPHSTLHKPPEL